MDNIPMRPADLIFPNRRQALASGVCHMSLAPFNCCRGNGTASEFKDGLSRREYEISGMCQACQDDIFESDVLDEEKEQDDEETNEYGDPINKSRSGNCRLDRHVFCGIQNPYFKCYCPCHKEEVVTQSFG